MLILNGNNLGERHRELNLKVAEAANKKTDIEEIKSVKEYSDVDRLFKIDLASKNKDFDYILETLKCGDSLYITRALKCAWLYDDEFSHRIYDMYLHHYVFPHMSLKMKKKLLTSISVHVRKESRVISYYYYCINYKLVDLSFKFVIFTPDSFKKDLIKDANSFKLLDSKSVKSSLFLKQFIGNSFALALEYVGMQNDVNRKKDIIYELRYLYSVSAEKYLDVIEDYEQKDADVPNNSTRLGLRISKDILKIHKARVHKYPVLYLNKLNKNAITRFLSTDEIRTLAHLLLPSSPSHFWSIDFYHTYKFILYKLPANEIYPYLKQIFTAKYNGNEFEMDKRFYDLKYYEILNAEEREEWALRHIEREEELFGSGNDYIWYKFVSFEKAFTGIKRYIDLTPDKDKRSEIVNILVESAKNQRDLTQLLNYYYDKHVYESEEHKESFINKVIAEHDIYAFDEECWTPLDKLFYNLQIYTIGYRGREQYKFRSTLYHILNKRKFPEGLQQFFENVCGFDSFEINNELSEERSFLISEYWLNFHAKKIKILLEKLPNDNVKEDIKDHISTIWNIIFSFKRNYDECPEIVLTFMKSDIHTWKAHPIFKEAKVKRTEGEFIRWLKKNTQLAIDGINEIRCNAYLGSFKLTRLFRKLKVYFSNDVAIKYLNYFTEFLSKPTQSYREYRKVKMAIIGTLMLADEEYKVSLMKKYAPVDPKIDDKIIDYRLLQVQIAICRLANHSRPPLPMSSIVMYLQGDYVRYCLPLFNTYLVNLPWPLALEFIQHLIHSPLSKQKQGLRLAFPHFGAEDLVKITSQIWQKTKSVSLRMVLYTELFKRVVSENGDAQKTMYELLEIFTLDINPEDHDKVFMILPSNDMPEGLRGNYIQTVWTVVSKFTSNWINLLRKIELIAHMEKNMHLVQREFIWQHVIKENIRRIGYRNKLHHKHRYDEIGEVLQAKWDITAKYIIHFNTPEELEQSLFLTRKIFNKCLQIWTQKYKNIYISRRFCYRFLNTIRDKIPEDPKRCINLVPIYECILDLMVNSLVKVDMYLLVWSMKLSIAVSKIIHEHFKSTDCVCVGGEPSLACIKGISVLYANAIEELIKQMMAKREFYYSFYKEMAKALKEISEMAARILKTSSSAFDILVGASLTNYKMTETHILALMIIPTDPPENWEETHKYAIEKINLYNNAEVQGFMYEKFVNNDLKVRNYVI